MSLQGELPKVFCEVHKRFRTPHVAIFLTAVLVLALTLSSSLIYALTVSTIARLLAYAATCAALPKLRYQKDAPAAMFLLPGGMVISILAILLTIWLLSNATLIEARDSGIALAMGLIIYFLYRAMKKRAVRI
jgi:amino acid transporter